MAHVSAQISHDHIVTAFHFFISNRGAELDEELLSSLPATLSSIVVTSTSLFSSAILLTSPIYFKLSDYYNFLDLQCPRK
jgi:hypothetical protein